MKKAFVINGANGTGKDTFVQLVKETLAPKGIQVFNISSVDRVKFAALVLGWNEVKDDKGRSFLSDLKDLSTKYYEGPLNYMREKYENGEDGIYFFHIREPHEIKKFVSICNGAKTIAMLRPTNTASNHADQLAYNYTYDITVENYGTLETLENQVREFCEWVNET